jgi:prevent-host-death family protein
MELSIREAKARFSEAAAAAARGERVVVTKNGEPFVQLVPAKRKGGVDWDKLAEARRKNGLEDVDPEALWPPEFDDPAFSRRVLGLEDE